LSQTKENKRGLMKEKENRTIEDIIKEGGYKQEHVEFANMIMEILTVSGNCLGHSTIADLLNIIHFTHLIALFNNGIIKYDSDDPNDATVMNYSAMFAKNIMSFKEKTKGDRKT
jgi:sulfur carrier protein ThiS